MAQIQTIEDQRHRYINKTIIIKKNCSFLGHVFESFRSHNFSTREQKRINHRPPLFVRLIAAAALKGAILFILTFITFD